MLNRANNFGWCGQLTSVTSIPCSTTSSRPGLGDFRLFFNRVGVFDVVLLEIATQKFERLFRSVRPVDQAQVFRRNGSCVHQCLEIDDLVPVLAAVNHHTDVLGELFGLRQGQQFKHLVEGTKASGKHHQRLGQGGEPQLAHEEVVELKIKVGRDVGDGNLLEGQVDVEADSLAARFVGAAVGRFHDARPAAGAHHKTVARLADGLSPLGNHEGQLARVFVIARVSKIGLGAANPLLGLGSVTDGCPQLLQRGLRLFLAAEAGGAEEDDGVLNALAAEFRQRLLILGQDAQNAAVGTVQELLVLVSQRHPLVRMREWIGFVFVGHEDRYISRGGMTANSYGYRTKFTEITFHASFVFIALARNCSYLVHFIDSYSYPSLPVGLSSSLREKLCRPRGDSDRFLALPSTPPSHPNPRKSSADWGPRPAACWAVMSPPPRGWASDSLSDRRNPIFRSHRDFEARLCQCANSIKPIPQIIQAMDLASSSVICAASKELWSMEVGGFFISD